MSDRKFNLHDGQKGSALAVRVTPRASHNEIVELLDDGTIKVRIAAPPSDSESNETLIEFLAEVLGVMQRCIEQVAKSSNRVTCSAKIDYRQGVQGGLASKVASVEQKLGRTVKK